MSTKIQLFAGLTLLGTIEAKVVDASMGVIGGTLKPTAAYFANYQPFFRAHLETPDWKGLAALDLKATSPLTGELTAAGGIVITDVTDQEGIIGIEADVCGIRHQQMNRLFPDA